MELMMQNFLVAAVLFGMSLFASQAHASELKIGSWGGNVRSGPSTDYPKIGSLKNGDPVVLLRKKKPANDGFNWFKIVYGNGQVGYQWGGILCGFNNKVNGTYGLCENDNRSTPRNYKCSDLTRFRSKEAEQKTKVTFFVGQTDNSFRIYWLDYNGNKKSYKKLSSGMSWTAETYRSHPWAIYRVSANGSEACHSIVKGKRKSSQWLLR
jgi:hypothetical protein